MMPIIVLFGDSLTQYGHGCERAFSAGAAGWGDRLSEVYARRADVLNRGCTQYNTRAALVTDLVPNLSADSAKPRTVFATIWFGANDACDAAKEPEKHVPLGEYKSNLEEIIRRVRMLTTNIIVITPPPIREERYIEWRKPQVRDPTLVQDRYNSAIAQYADACKDVAARFNVPFIDLFSIFQSSGKMDSLLTDEDGLHLSGAGDAFVYELVHSAISFNFPSLVVSADAFAKNYSNSGSSCEGLAPYLPFWDHIDPREYRSQLALDEDEESIEKFSWPRRPGIVLLGDSITQQGRANPFWCQSDVDSPVYAGWGDYVAARYARRIDVYNRGLAGYNTKWTLAAFDRLFTSSDRRSFPVELVTIFFGANDAADAVLNPRQHVGLAEFENNIQEIVRRCKNEWDARRIVLISCPPIHREKYLAWVRSKPANKSKTDEELEDRTVELARKYRDAIEKVAKKHKLPFVDTFAAFGDSYSECLSDGLHLSPKGNRILGDVLIRTIDAHWPEMKCTPDSLRKKYGFAGSSCHACAPEQKWFSELYVSVADDATSISKRVKL